jgi:NAD(P)-dependent dehydrogenase (short-subunit alcohol dehydrogenase family)
VELTEAYDGVTAYRRAKLALAAWTFDLAEEVADTDVVVNCVHPATFMDTDMVRESGVRPASTVEEGGTAVLRLIIEDTGTGEFYDGDRTVRAHRDAYNRAVRSSLRRVTDDALR